MTPFVNGRVASYLLGEFPFVDGCLLIGVILPPPLRRIMKRGAGIGALPVSLVLAEALSGGVKSGGTGV